MFTVTYPRRHSVPVRYSLASVTITVTYPRRHSVTVRCSLASVTITVTYPRRHSVTVQCSLLLVAITVVVYFLGPACIPAIVSGHFLVSGLFRCQTHTRVCRFTSDRLSSRVPQSTSCPWGTLTWRQTSRTAFRYRRRCGHAFCCSRAGMMWTCSGG